MLHVSVLLGLPEGDSQAVQYITAVDGCPIVLHENLPQDGPEGPKHVGVN
jgi:hypothetical protein